MVDSPTAPRDHPPYPGHAADRTITSGRHTIFSSSRPLVSRLNELFWFGSIAVWTMIMGRFLLESPADFGTSAFWINFLLFIAAGIGVLATTHFAAAALPLWIGMHSLTDPDLKAAWAYTFLYVIFTTLIGIPALLLQLDRYLNRRAERQETEQ